MCDEYTKVVAKEAKKILFSYKLYRKAEAQAKALTKNGPTDIIQHEAIKTQYRQNMEKPVVKNKDLSDFMDWLYRDNSDIGSGSAADAFRYTENTGKLVKGSDHAQKVRDAKAFLERWIERNPTATPNDRSAAENVLKDLEDALGDKLWYSQTKPPK